MLQVQRVGEFIKSLSIVAIKTYLLEVVGEGILSGQCSQVNFNLKIQEVASI